MSQQQYAEEITEIWALFKETDAGLEFAEGADRYAYRRGLFVLNLSGDGLVQIQNDRQFQPRDFGLSPDKYDKHAPRVEG